MHQALTARPHRVVAASTANAAGVYSSSPNFCLAVLMPPLPVDWSRLRSVLCIGAHCDDIEIGCAATLLAIRERAPAITCRWVVLSGAGERESETRKAGNRLLGESLQVSVADFRTSYFPACWGDIKDCFEQVKASVEPDLILTHWLEDRHQDHRIVAELTWNTFRHHQVLEYEIPKYEGDLGRPNLYVPSSPEHTGRKVEALMSCFPSQHSRPWFRPEVFSGLMALRGMECNASSGYAEAFHARKLIM